MDVTLTDWQPLKWRKDLPGLAPYPFKLAVHAGQDNSLRSDTGFTAYTFVDSRGNTRLVVPDLNWFAVVRQNLETGRREVYTNVTMGEPDPGLFEPDPGSSVKRLNVKRGIVRQTQEAR
jgi:hypothetical protein